jgi:hypothetical protein
LVSRARFVVGPCLDLSGVNALRSTVTLCGGCCPLFDFGDLQSILRSILATTVANNLHAQSGEPEGRHVRPGGLNERGSSHELCFPTARVNVADPLLPFRAARGSFLTRYGPSSGFGYPRDGLLPATPSQACFVLAALLGFGPSKRSPHAGWRHVSMPAEPACRSFDAYSRAFARTGTSNRDFQDLAPAVSPWPADPLFTGDGLAAPLGFRLSRVCGWLPCVAALTALLPLRAFAPDIRPTPAP